SLGSHRTEHARREPSCHLAAEANLGSVKHLVPWPEVTKRGRASSPTKANLGDARTWSVWPERSPDKARRAEPCRHRAAGANLGDASSLSAWPERSPDNQRADRTLLAVERCSPGTSCIEIMPWCFIQPVFSSHVRGRQTTSG